MSIAFYYKFEVKKRRNEKLNLNKFIQSSEINHAKILWLQVINYAILIL